MAHHGQEITTALYGIVDWSWTGHGTTPPALVEVESVNEGFPLEYVDKGNGLPALFFVKDSGWPSIVHYPKHTTETFTFSIYAVCNLPETGYPETEVRTLLHNVITNILASKRTDVSAYNLTYPMGLSYIEDIKWLGTEVRDEIQEYFDSMGLRVICARADFAIQAKGTER